MAFVAGPERMVWVPGARESEESSEVAKVRVRKGVVLASGSGHWDGR